MEVTLERILTCWFFLSKCCLSGNYFSLKKNPHKTVEWDPYNKMVSSVQFIDLDSLLMNHLFWFGWGLFSPYWGCTFPSLYSFVTLSCSFQDHFFSSPNSRTSHISATEPLVSPSWLRKGRGVHGAQRMEILQSVSGKESLSHFYSSKLHYSTFSAQLLFSLEAEK